MSRFDIFLKSLYDADAMDWTTTTWTTASYVFLHWRCVSESRRACMLPCHIIGVSFEWDIFFVFSIAVCKCIRTQLMGP